MADKTPKRTAIELIREIDTRIDPRSYETWDIIVGDPEGIIYWKDWAEAWKSASCEEWLASDTQFGSYSQIITGDYEYEVFDFDEWNHEFADGCLEEDRRPEFPKLLVLVPPQND